MFEIIIYHFFYIKNIINFNFILIKLKLNKIILN
jgi:hypothetical protein